MRLAASPIRTGLVVKVYTFITSTIGMWRRGAQKVSVCLLRTHRPPGLQHGIADGLTPLPRVIGNFILQGEGHCRVSSTHPPTIYR